MIERHVSFQFQQIFNRIIHVFDVLFNFPGCWKSRNCPTVNTLACPRAVTCHHHPLIAGRCLFSGTLGGTLWLCFDKSRQTLNICNQTQIFWLVIKPSKISDICYIALNSVFSLMWIDLVPPWRNPRRNLTEPPSLFNHIALINLPIHQIHRPYLLQLDVLWIHAIFWTWFMHFWTPCVRIDRNHPRFYLAEHPRSVAVKLTRDQTCQQTSLCLVEYNSQCTWLI